MCGRQEITRVAENKNRFNGLKVVRSHGLLGLCPSDRALRLLGFIGLNE